jgi:PAS domain S-box-containing protein
MINADGQFRDVDVCAVRIHQADRSYVLAMLFDQTDRKAAEESRMLLAAAIEQVTDAIAITGTDGVIEYANRAFQVLTGIPAQEAPGWNLSDLLERDEIHKALGQAALGTPWGGLIDFQSREGKALVIDMTCSPIREAGSRVRNLVVVMRDVTKESELELGLRQSQKMEALGSLAAGIAHDSNNILTTILTSAELIKWKLPSDSPLLSRVDVILQAGLCAAGLNKQILSFSRKSDEKRIPMDLSAIAREALRMLKATLPANIELRSEFMSGVWVEGDPVQLHQIILNLAINAIHAMQTQGGVLTITLNETRFDDQTTAAPLAPGRYALLTVKDTGCGMDSATLERIFDPFFTTKPQGEGTGLGLSVVHASVSKIGGKITVSSTVGKGSEFRIHWPCVTGGECPITERPPEDVGGSESILFVDDEELVAALAKLGLQNLGYSVTSCTDPVRALEMFAAHPDAYDLVFTDLAMPGLNGVDLACRIHEIRRQTPILLVSGLPLATALSLNSQARFHGIVAKPFTAFDLADAARKVLDQEGMVRNPSVLEAISSEGGGRKEGAILLVEDSHVTRAMIRTWLERHGREVVEARDGQEAWELFTLAANRGRFALVLTDVVMPRMDGLELIQLIRRTAPSVPVAVLTSNKDNETVKSALNLGVNEFLNKPFEQAELLECVERLMAIRHARISTRRSVETAKAVRLAQKSLVAVPEKDLPLFSLYEPLSDAGGDVFRCMKCADGSIFFILADVAGHSVVSSYAVAAFLGMLSTYIGECSALMAMPTLSSQVNTETPLLLHSCGFYGKIPCNPLKHLALKFNQGIQTGPFSEVPICVLMGLWTPETGHLRLLNAGIPHGLLCGKAESSARYLELNGTPLGVFPEPLVEECTLQLRAGDRLLFGTDGFFDVLSPAKQLFQDRAARHWDALRESRIDEALSVVCEEARNHGTGVIDDDLLVIGFEQPRISQGVGELVLRLPSTPRAVDMACDRLSDCIRATEAGARLASEKLFDISLAVREALTNAMIHGNRSRPDALMSLRCVVNSECLTVSVGDEGPGFDLQAHVPPEDPLSERGRGIPLMRSYAQSLRMDGSQITMTFQLEECIHDDREITTAQ